MMFEKRMKQIYNAGWQVIKMLVCVFKISLKNNFCFAFDNDLTFKKRSALVHLQNWKFDAEYVRQRHV